MPLYEFYCKPCHTVFTFHSVRVNTTTIPGCPQCGEPLKREVSGFACLTQDQGSDPDAYAMPGEMERVISSMDERVRNIDLEGGNPREAASVIRAMAAAGGLAFKPEVMEAIRRIEAGADPEQVDLEFGEVLESDDPFADFSDSESKVSVNLGRKSLQFAPNRDPRWYDL